jgi:predicted RNase H-like HicB family nuclease
MRFFNRTPKRETSGATLDPSETFTVLVHQEDGGYWGEVPELPGCASQGETIDELLHNIIDAIQGCIQVHLEDEGPHLRHAVMTMNVTVPVPVGESPGGAVTA